MKVAAIIPARYASSRFPGKPLVDILGKPMIQRVYERVAQVPGISRVIVATDDQRIYDAVNGFGEGQHRAGGPGGLGVCRDLDLIFGLDVRQDLCDEDGVDR